MSEHTKGPWKACGDGCDEGFIRQTGEGKLWIASVIDIPGGQEATEANARLIAAAPDMLEFIKRQHNGVVCVCRMNATVAPFGAGIECTACEMDALIAKAEGR